MKKLWLFSTIILWSCVVFGQNDDGNNFNSYYTDPYANIIPQTPNAASFTAYGNMPVNTSTGLPSISIPITNVSVDGVQVPISLSYHASGIKVADVSSVVGLKWTLNAGGGIFRSVNDLDDFKTGVGWTKAGSQSHFDQWLQSHIGFDYSDKTKQAELQTDISHMDNFPDSFNYNFLGFSGTFVYKPDGTILMGDLKSDLTHLSLLNAGDYAGNQYLFNKTETNLSSTVAYVENELDVNFSRDVTTVSWMLHQIITKNGKTIDFEYIESTYDDEEYMLASQRLVSSLGYECGVGYPLGSETEGKIWKYDNRVKATGIKNISKNQLISKISTETIEVNFLYIDDLLNGNTPISGWDKRLDKIVIKDKIENKEKEFTFTYNVYDGDARLKLTEIQEKGFDGTSKPPYKFYYENGNLPLKSSFSQDRLGYYNGASNASFLPKTSFTLDNKFVYNTGGGNAPVIVYPGYEKLSNRYFNINYLKTGVLNKIEYPTGGWTEYFYEPNAFGENLQEPLLETATTSIASSSGFNPMNDPLNSQYNTYNMLIEIKQPFGRIKFNHQGDCPVCGESDFRVSKVLLYQYNGQLGDPINFSDRVTPEVSRFAVDNEHEYAPLPSTPGVYLLQLQVHKDFYPPATSSAPFMTVYLEWNQQPSDTNDNLIYQEHYNGGLRVSEIKDVESNGNDFNLTKFTYLDAFTRSTYDSNLCRRLIGGQYILSSEMVNAHGTQQGQGYVYTKVEKETIDRLDYGRIVEYYQPRNFFYNSTNGELIKTEVYNKNNQLLQLEEITYLTSDPSANTFGFAIPTDMHTSYNTSIACQLPNSDPDDPVFNHNWPKAGYTNAQYVNNYFAKWSLPQEKKATKFLKTGGVYQPVTAVTKYEYNDDLLVITEEIDTHYGTTVETNGDITYDPTFNPGGEIVKIENEYPSNYPNENSLQSIPVGSLVGKKVFKDLDHVLGQYFEFDNAGNITATYKYYKGIGSHTGATYIPSNYQKVATFLNDNGSPIQVTRENGINVTYLWDATNTYMLAEIINATHATADNYITIPLDMSTLSNNQIAAEIDNIRQGLPQAQVTTYLYNPIVGITEMIDPKGISIKYTYDAHGRLEYVKDKDDKVLSRNEYHYKNN